MRQLEQPPKRSHPCWLQKSQNMNKSFSLQIFKIYFLKINAQTQFIFPQKHVHASSQNFSLLQQAQKFFKYLPSDVIERLFIQQVGIDEQKRFIEFCEENDPVEEALMKKLRKKKNVLSTLLFELQEYSLERPKIIDLITQILRKASQKGEQYLQMKSYQPFQPSASNYFVSSQQSFNNSSINRSEQKEPHGDRLYFFQQRS
ncbi:unnamed protein product [Paramecium primaurelia]|uniref:Uncharacterized protein n=1 Tax=Paramecium primaurelia TaxID=5886 RepID=A0A8S1QMZ8_PARPR|nr:unnamed protein product [Paramecium primaurelia]CAD8115862.1 unnamed protein product [Paramecium primaurelia]